MCIISKTPKIGQVNGVKFFNAAEFSPLNRGNLCIIGGDLIGGDCPRLIRVVWTAEEVDAQLKKMMKNIHDASAKAAKDYGLGYDLVAGGNIAGFIKVADAMMAQGLF